MTDSRAVSSVVCKRYAGALIDLAEQSKCLNKVMDDLSSLRGIIDKSPDFVALIRSPLIGKAKQVSILSDIATKAKFHELTFNFLGVLANNRRLKILADIIKVAESIVAERSGQVAVSIKTAVALNESQKKDLKTKISSNLGRDVSLEIYIDPSILGGMIVTIGSKMIDDSVKRKLDRLNNALTKRTNINNIQTIKEVV